MFKKKFKIFFYSFVDSAFSLVFASIFIRYWTYATVFSAALILSGCVSQADQETLKNAPTMSEAYQAALQDSQGNTLSQIRTRVASNSSVPQLRTTVTSANSAPQYGANVDNDDADNSAVDDVSKEFPTLPNPTMGMYVYPHLAGDDQSPVPGYFTAFSLYTEEHYAVPGETGIN